MGPRGNPLLHIKSNKRFSFQRKRSYYCDSGRLYYSGPHVNCKRGVMSVRNGINLRGALWYTWAFAMPVKIRSTPFTYVPKRGAHIAVQVHVFFEADILPKNYVSSLACRRAASRVFTHPDAVHHRYITMDILFIIRACMAAEAAAQSNAQAKNKHSW